MRLSITLFFCTLALLSCSPKREYRQVIANRAEKSMPVRGGFIVHDNGRLLHWKTLPVTIHFTSGFSDEFKDACKKAAGTLNRAAGKDLFSFSEIEEKAAARDNQINTLGMGRIAGRTGQEQGQTRLTFGNVDERIFEADIDLDDQHYAFSTVPEPGSADMESVCLHELGHALGMGHSSSPDSFMYGTLMVGKTRRELTDEDQFHLLSVY